MVVVVVMKKRRAKKRRIQKAVARPPAAGVLGRAAAQERRYITSQGPSAIPFEQKEPDYLLWGCFRSSFASSSTPAGCLLQLIHGLDEGARSAKSGCKKSY
jgi:hypothetical protein